MLHIGFKQLQKLHDQQCSDYFNQKMCDKKRREKIFCKKRTRRREKENVTNRSSICTKHTHRHRHFSIRGVYLAQQKKERERGENSVFEEERKSHHDKRQKKRKKMSK